MAIPQENKKGDENQMWHKARHGSVSALEYQSNVKIGLITEISGTGLAFRYLAHNAREGQEPKWPSDETLIITCNFKEYHLESLPCKLVSDRDVSSQYAFSHTPMRKCCVEFGELSPEQIMQLEQFIEKCSEGPSKEALHGKVP